LLNRIATRYILACAAAIYIIAGTPSSICAQNPSEIDELAIRTAKYLIVTKPTILVIAPRETCNLAFQICETFDSALRSNLQLTVPQLQIIGREDVVTEVKKAGLLSIDAYNPFALRLVGLSTNADAIVTEDLLWEKEGFELRIDIHDTKTDELIAPFRSLETKVARSLPDTPDNPMLVTGPDAQVSVIVFKGRMPKGFVYPGCDKCPDPHSVGMPGVVQVIGTITIQGKVENVSVIRSPSPAFTKAALNALRSWKFRSAVGTDGKAFATRQPIEVSFAH
jgi:TonB family protein